MKQNPWKRFSLFLLVWMVQAMGVRAQDGRAGLHEANVMVRQYFESGTDLLYAVGALLGLIGAVKV